MQGKEPAHDPAAERLSPMQRAMACRTTFKLEYPDVRLSIRQGSPSELAERVISGETDIAIATETLDRYPELVTQPCIAGIEINVLTAIDTDVTKTYVRQDLGIGIIASVAIDAERDFDLVALDGSMLFPERTTKLATRRGTCLRSFVKDFISSFPSILQSR